MTKRELKEKYKKKYPKAESIIVDDFDEKNLCVFVKESVVDNEFIVRGFLEKK